MRRWGKFLRIAQRDSENIKNPNLFYLTDNSHYPKGESMVRISKFSQEEKVVVLETVGGKIRISFDEWHHIVVMYNKFVAETKP